MAPDPRNLDAARVALPTAQIITLSDHRKASPVLPEAEPMFKPRPERPAFDINEARATLETLSHLAAAGVMDRALLAGHLASLAANLKAAVPALVGIDHRAFLAEAVISRQNGGAEGKALAAIIRAEFHKARRAARAERIAANREARRPKVKRR